MMMSRPLRLMVHAASLVLVLLAAKAGYDFGLQLSGWVLGVVIGANAALFCALVAGSLADRLTAPRDTA